MAEETIPQPTEVQETQVEETPVEGEETPETESPESPQETPPVDSTEVKQLKEDKKGLVGQLKNLRIKNQQQEVLLQTRPSTPKNGEDEEPEDKTKTTVLNVLQEEKDKERKENSIAALETFQTTHPEFHPENDISGLRMDRLNRKLSTFNMQGLTSVDSILTIYEDAYKLTQESPMPTETPVDMSSEASTPTGTPAPKVTDTRLSPEEEEIRIGKGWTVEKFLDMKEKYPDVISPYTG